MNTKEYLEQIVEKYGLQVKNRQRELVYQRFAFCYFARSLGYTLATIAKLINRDHSTVDNALNQAQNLLDVNDSLYAECTYLLQLELEQCPKPIQKNKKENPFLTLINRLFEAKDMNDIQALKEFVNENINPKKIK